MNSRIDQITKGLISVAVMLMFTVAFIAGQARANLQADAAAIGETAVGSEISVILDAKSLQKLESLSHLVDILIALPIDIEFGADDLSISISSPDEKGADESAAH